MTWHLETDRLLLRPMVLGDLDAFHAVVSDPVSMRFYPKPFDRAATRGWIERAQQRYREHGFACRDHAWEVLPVDRPTSLIRPENVPSWSVARTLGFRAWRSTVRAGMGHVVWTLERAT